MHVTEIIATNLTFEVSMEALKQANCERNLDRRRLVGLFFLVIPAHKRKASFTAIRILNTD